MRRIVEIEWVEEGVRGTIDVAHGQIAEIAVASGRASIDGRGFAAHEDSRLRLRVSVDASPARFGEHSTIVTVTAGDNAFSFFVHEVSPRFPIFLEEYGVAVFPESSPLTYDTLAQRLRASPLQTRLGAIETGPEPTYDHAAARTQDVPCETLLGLSRDRRLFAVSPDVETIEATYSIRFRPRRFRLPIGRGKGPRTDRRRRLDDGVLPILHATTIDDDIRYELTMLATLVRVSLTEQNVAGTHFLIAEHGLGMAHTPAQARRREAAEEAARRTPSEPIMLAYRLTAVNAGHTPRLAFFYTPTLTIDGSPTDLAIGPDGALTAGATVYAAARLDDAPWSSRQVAIMLQPGDVASAEYRIAHEPDGRVTAGALFARPFDHLLAEAHTYWQRKLESGARLSLPERRLDEMARAGLLHLDLITYGEREGTLAPCVGVYSPIGSESAPIMQFYDVMGWHDVARRCLRYFLEKQHDDGFMQNFGGYMLETGAVLWTMGEHFRYTRDEQWARSVAGNVTRACEWIVTRRHADSPDRNAPGAGLIVGKNSDPEDPFRQFMLNGYQYLGLARAAELLQAADPPAAARFAAAASAYREDIRRALDRVFALSPVVPLGDGRYVPSCAPWAEGWGYAAMGLDGRASYTHGSVYARDSLNGPLYAIFTEVLDVHDRRATWLLDAHHDYMCQEGIAFSQPYYAPHPLLNLRRGQVHAFLAALYSGIASLADRETYTFWEHLFGVSTHKTHEEAWFLMQLRWMLYLEDGDTLRLLPGIPRRYLADEQALRVDGAGSYFGPLYCTLEAHLDRGYVRAAARCPEGARRGLRQMGVRVPHPDGRHARRVRGGEYDAAAETVWLAGAAGEAVLEF